MWWLLGGLLFLFVLGGKARAASSPDSPDGGTDPRIVALAEAIAHAEGFFAGDTLPARRNNPGSLTGPGGGLNTYGTVADGWADLYDYLSRMLTGAHWAYTPSMSWRQAAEVYTGHDKAAAWAAIVCGDLGISTDSTLAEYLA